MAQLQIFTNVSLKSLLILINVEMFRFKKLDLDNSGSLSVEEFMSLPELQQNPLVQRVIGNIIYPSQLRHVVHGLYDKSHIFWTSN